MGRGVFSLRIDISSVILGYMTDETTPKRVRKGQKPEVEETTPGENPVVAAASEPAYKATSSDKVMLVMLTGAGWVTASGADFSSTHPYQLVNEDEVDALLTTGRFRQASGEEVKRYYKGD